MVDATGSFLATCCHSPGFGVVLAAELSLAGVARREYGVLGGKGDCPMLRVLDRFGFCSPGPGENPGENFREGEKLKFRSDAKCTTPCNERRRSAKKC